MSNVDTTGWLTAYDATNWQAETDLPKAGLYFLYNDADYAAPAAAYDEFESRGLPIATIAVFNTTVANEYDWETGNQNDPVPYAVNMRKTYGYTGVVYCNEQSVSTVLAQFAAAGVAPPLFALANWTGVRPTTVPDYGAGTVRIQYSDQGDGGQVDLSLISPRYPVIGPRLGTTPSPKPAPKPVPTPEPVPAPSPYQFRAEHNPYTPVAVDGSFGPASTRALQYLIGASVDGVFGPATVKALQKMLGTVQDGVLGPVTVKALQAKVGASQDGDWGGATSSAVQQHLNEGTLY